MPRTCSSWRRSVCCTSNWSHVPSRCLSEHSITWVSEPPPTYDSPTPARICASRGGPIGSRSSRANSLPSTSSTAVAEHARDRGALVRHRPVGVEHGDQVARVRDERAEARLAPPAVEVLGERRSLDGERDLGGERLERVEELAREPASGEQKTSSPRVSSRTESGRSSAESPPSRSKLAADALGQSRDLDLLACLGGRRAASARRLRRRPTRSCVAGRGRDDRAVSAEQERGGRRLLVRAATGPHETAASLHLVAAGRRDELDAGAPQRELARGRAAPPGARGRPCARRRAGTGAPRRR